MTNLYHFFIGFCLVIGIPVCVAIIGYIAREKNFKDGLAKWYDDLITEPWAVWFVGVGTSFATMFIFSILALIARLMILIGRGITGE